MADEEIKAARGLMLLLIAAGLSLILMAWVMHVEPGRHPSGASSLFMAALGLLCVFGGARGSLRPPTLRLTADAVIYTDTYGGSKAFPLKSIDRFTLFQLRWQTCVGIVLRDEARSQTLNGRLNRMFGLDGWIPGIIGIDPQALLDKLNARLQAQRAKTA